MAVNSAMPPYFTFQDGSGQPLENGYIYIGQPGFEARSTPKASWFDITANTIPTGTASGAAIRTRGGFPVNQSNAVSMFYVDGDYSISVCDRNGVLLYSALSMTFALNVGGAVGPVLAPDGNLAATGFGFVNEANTGFIRPSANTLQTVVGGVLVATQTTTGVVFSQPVSGAGFSSGVLAIAQPLDADLTALAGLSGTGIAVRTAGNTWAQRQIVSSDGSVNITNPAGIAGDIGLSTGTIVGLNTTTGASTVGPFALPAGVKKFTVTSDDSSLNGTGNMIVQLRVGGSFVTTGYTSRGLRGANNISSTSGMIVALGGATAVWSGAMNFWLHDPATNLWLCSLSSGPSDTATNTDVIFGSGRIALAGAVDGVRINSTAGTFDISSLNVNY
jgi:hypothetical protein